jgi:hypothetical protein
MLWAMGGAQGLARSGYVDTLLGQRREGEDWIIAILGLDANAGLGPFGRLLSRTMKGLGGARLTSVVSAVTGD